jgi:hypothetical protein
MQAPVAKSPATPYNWHPAGFVEEHHPKIQAMMEPFLMKFRGWCSVSNILMASSKRFDSLPKLDAYLNGVCWLHSIATCPYGAQCAFAARHVPTGTLTDAQANEVEMALQAGVMALVTWAGAPSPIGKCKSWLGTDWGDHGDAVLLVFGLWGCVTECLLSKRRREERRSIRPLVYTNLRFAVGF